MGLGELFTSLLLVYAIPQFAFAPLWVRLARRVGKKRLWMLGLAISAVGFTGVFFITPGDWQMVFGLVFLVASGMGVGVVVSPSLQADAVDYDEMRTGERKEGAYSAIWNFIRKTGFALAAGAGGLALTLAGYDGAAEVQTESVGLAIRLAMSVLPSSLYVCAILILSRYALDEDMHREIQRRIAERETRPYQPQ